MAFANGKFLQVVRDAQGSGILSISRHSSPVTIPSSMTGFNSASQRLIFSSRKSLAKAKSLYPSMRFRISKVGKGFVSLSCRLLDKFSRSLRESAIKLVLTRTVRVLRGHSVGFLKRPT